MKALVVIIIITLLLVLPVGWVKNIIKLTQCDFEAPYNAEIIHGVGIVPIVGAVTGWMDFGK